MYNWSQLVPFCLLIFLFFSDLKLKHRRWYHVFTRLSHRKHELCQPPAQRIKSFYPAKTFWGAKCPVLLTPVTGWVQMLVLFLSTWSKEFDTYENGLEGGCMECAENVFFTAGTFKIKATAQALLITIMIHLFYWLIFQWLIVICIYFRFLEKSPNVVSDVLTCP